MQSDPDRRARDDRKIQEILGQKAEQVERPLGDIAPGPATYVLEKIMMQLVPFVGVCRRHQRNRGVPRNVRRRRPGYE